jgi:hypothetical protein
MLCSQPVGKYGALPVMWCYVENFRLSHFFATHETDRPFQLDTNSLPGMIKSPTFFEKYHDPKSWKRGFIGEGLTADDEVSCPF